MSKEKGLTNMSVEEMTEGGEEDAEALLMAWEEDEAGGSQRARRKRTGAWPVDRKVSINRERGEKRTGDGPEGRKEEGLRTGWKDGGLQEAGLEKCRERIEGAELEKGRKGESEGEKTQERKGRVRELEKEDAEQIRSFT